MQTAQGASLHSLKIRDLQLLCRLGVSEEERSLPQDVRVSMELRFLEIPNATVSDDIRDAICYGRISEALVKHIGEKEFHLVEKMAADFYKIVKGILEGRAELQLTVHKVRPPIKQLMGGVEYTIGDFV